MLNFAKHAHVHGRQRLTRCSCLSAHSSHPAVGRAYDQTSVASSRSVVRLGRRGWGVVCRAEKEEKDELVSFGQKEPEAAGSAEGILGADEDWDSSDSEDEDGQQILLEQEKVEDPFESHSSRMITQEVLLFCFQQELDCQHMRALNLDQLERAQLLRDRLQTIDAAISEIQDIKKSGGPSEPDESQEVDFSASFRLRTRLQDAIMDERYEEAAKLRDDLKVLQEKLDEASRGQEAVKEKLKEQLKLRLGQRVLLKQDGHRGVICGWDPSCSETKEWQSDNGIDNLEFGGDQPFYQVLVDLFDSLKSGSRSGLIKYVAQEMLSTPEPEQVWAEKYGDEQFHNPFVDKMFLGLDECGDYLPTSALRSKFSQERRDVFPPPSLQEPELSEDELRKLITQQSEDLKLFDKLAGEKPSTPPDSLPDLSDDFAP